MIRLGLLLISSPFVPGIVEAHGQSAPPALGTTGQGVAVTAHPEARPFPASGRARADIAAALERARSANHRTLLIFGGNWCHDSRALAGWFATPRFRAMLATRYEIVWVNVGKKSKNLDIARTYGLDGIPGTPTVLMLDARGAPLNLTDAPTWRNAGSRSEDAIYDYFAKG